MSYDKAAIGALLGGIVGVAAWAAIAFAVGFEFALLAAALGAAIGYGARLLLQKEKAPEYGVVALTVLAGAFFLGKYAAVLAVTQRGLLAIRNAEIAYSDYDMIAREARSIVIVRMNQRNPPRNWPSGKSLSNAEAPSDFPSDIASEAMRRWGEVGDKNIAREDAVATERMLRRKNLFNRRRDAFSESFGFLDLLGFPAACGLAFFLAAGSLSRQTGKDKSGVVQVGDLLRAADADDLIHTPSPPPETRSRSSRTKSLEDGRGLTRAK